MHDYDIHWSKIGNKFLNPSDIRNSENCSSGLPQTIDQKQQTQSYRAFLLYAFMFIINLN